jgi:hypothetical protein
MNEIHALTLVVELDTNIVNVDVWEVNRSEVQQVGYPVHGSLDQQPVVLHVILGVCN